jgi:23S rRNA (cytosine1962-C5)-methyltransferase
MRTGVRKSAQSNRGGDKREEMETVEQSKNTPKITLKKGRDKAIRNRHHWIFSGAVQEPLPAFENGSVLPVYSYEGDLLGSAYCNTKTSIFGRMISFDDTPPEEAIKQHIIQAKELRNRLFDSAITNAYRIINGEGDLIPGLIIDKYDSVLVVQIATLGMEKLKPLIIDVLRDQFHPECIYEKSDVPARSEEGLKPVKGILYGTLPEKVRIKENGFTFLVDSVNGQKTGFYLDQREMRKLIGTLSSGKRVLDCFAYTGGFSVYAACNDAAIVDSIDSSASAMELAKLNCSLNKQTARCNFLTDNVFTFLREHPLNYDIIILDPPAFAKRKSDVIKACRGYKDINRLALHKMPPNSLLLTCSCSYYIDDSLFQKVIFEAAVEAQRTVRIIQKHHLAPDHPINVCHPEGNYLKSLLLYVE